MKIKAGWGVVLGLLGLVPAASAQVPGVPAVPGAAAPVVGAPIAGAPVAGAAAPRNIWSFLCMTPEQKAACRAKICNSQLGQLLNNSLKPASALTGGVIPSLCPDVNAADLLKPPDSAEGAAAAIKADEAGAKKRRAAVRYLGTVDCRYWPEAQDALINSLRADRNECVRLEAAFSLGRGCCCNKKTMVALILTVTGSDEDGNPSEPSERVRVTAEAALRHCLDCYVEIKPIVPPKKVQILPLPMPEEVDPKPLPVPQQEPKEPDLKEKPTPKPKNGEKDPNNGKPKDEKSNGEKNNGEKKTDLLPVPQEAKKNAQPVLPSKLPFYQQVERLSREQIVATAQKALKLLPNTTNVPPPGMVSSGKSLVEIVHHAFGASPTGTAATETAYAHSVPTTVEPALTTQVVPATVAPSASPAASLPYDSVPSSYAPQGAQPTQPSHPRGFVPIMLEGKSSTPQPVQPAERRPTRSGSSSGLIPKLFGGGTASRPYPVMDTSVQTAQLSAPEQEVPIAPATYASLEQPVTTPVAPAVHTDSATSSPYALVTPANQSAPRELTPRVESSAVPGSVGSPTADLLNVLRMAEEPERRTWAAAQLGTVRDAGKEIEVVETLLERAENDSSLMVRLTCLNAIQRRGTPHYQIPPVLQRLAKDPNASVRRKAAEVESGMKTEAAGPSVSLPSR